MHSLAPATSREMRPFLSQRSALRLFGSYTRWKVARHFHALRLVREGWPVLGAAESALIAVTHPSWWDPLVGLVIAQHLWPDRPMAALIDAQALERYKILETIGFLGVREGRAGAQDFLQAVDTAVQTPGMILWFTPQGRLADVRDRPLALRPGFSHVRDRITTVPLALEYSFWAESRPEALACFGEKNATNPATALTEAQDRLGRLSQRRDADAFTEILQGTYGTGFLHDSWQHFRAALRGERFSSAHSALPSRRDTVSS
jgi:hypothetical protein